VPRTPNTQVEEVEPEAAIDEILPNIGGKDGYFDHDEVSSYSISNSNSNSNSNFMRVSRACHC
jgi:hypothetical protein